MSNVTDATAKVDVTTLKKGNIFSIGDGIDWKVISNNGTVVKAIESVAEGTHIRARHMNFTSERVYVISR